MIDQFFYTAIFRPSSGEVLTPFAEHFADEVERNKRAKQFEAHARSLGEDDPWMVYTGTEPVEAYLARVNAPMIAKGEAPEEIAGKIDALAAKAGAKTASVLTAPEVDDSQEARPLPAWAVAQAEVERAERAVRDAQDGVDEAQAKADAAALEFLGPDADNAETILAGLSKQDEAQLKVAAAGLHLPTMVGEQIVHTSFPPPPIGTLRRKAIEAQTTVDQQKGRLYHAEQDLKAKREVYDALKAEADEVAAFAAQG